MLLRRRDLLLSLLWLCFHFSSARFFLFGGLGLRHFAGRIKIQDSAAGIAGDDLFVGADLLPGLGTHHHKTGHTFLVAGLGKGRFALPHHAVIVGQGAVIYRGADRVTLFLEPGQKLFVLGGPDARFGFFFVHVGGLGLQLGFRHFQGLFFILQANHQFQNLVFATADLLLREFHLMHQGAVLVIGFDARRLASVLGDLFLKTFDVGFHLAAGGLIALDPGLGLLHGGFVLCQVCFAGRP